MRRSICYCEPSVALAGQRGKWKFVYTTANALPKGAKLKFDINSKGRDIDWEVPETGTKVKENALWGETEGGKAVHPIEIELDDSWVPHYEFTLPEALAEGGSFTLHMGPGKDSRKKDDVSGTSCQHHVQRRRPFFLSVDPTGKGNYEDPELFLIDIRGNEVANIRVITPSHVQKNKRFDVIIRFEDEHGNLSANTDEDTLVELSHEQLRDNLSWKIFVPETGFITLPNLYFNEEGIFTITLKNLKTDETFQSAPIRCVPDAYPNIFWGLLHGESERVDSTENVEACMRHFRDEKALSFFASSPFESEDETPQDVWKSITNNVAEFNETDRFVNILGFQWAGNHAGEGNRIFIYGKDNKPILRKKESKSNTLRKIYKSLAPNELISIPNFTMGKGMGCDWSQFNPEFERVVEIYNAWGSSECTKKQGNTFPIEPEGREGVKEDGAGSIVSALNQNLRFGFVAGGLDDRGTYADFYDNDQVQYPPGMTAILSKEMGREHFYKALHDRACYATTGERMVVDIRITGASMGQELSVESKPGLVVNRHIIGFAAGTDDLETVEIIRNGKVLTTLECEGHSLNFTYDDLVDLNSVALDSPDKRPPFVYYYLRVTQKDGHRAWSSPIWVDCLPKAKKK